MLEKFLFFIEVLDELGLFINKKVILREKKSVGLPSSVWILNLYQPDRQEPLYRFCSPVELFKV
jgi:hypothetical protein